MRQLWVGVSIGPGFPFSMNPPHQSTEQARSVGFVIRCSLFLVGICATFLAGGCSVTLPVTGRFESGAVTFEGSATGYMDGGGTITLTASNGLKVQGVFVYVTRREGEGTFTASDGRSGSFKFVSTGRRGTGTGNLGEDKVTFTFGVK